MPIDTDVLVVGSGIAGVTAAIEAASAGARTTVASVGKFLSGSSFYPGTWGLGLIGPEDDDDVDNLVASILEVGQGVADPGIVRSFVAGIAPAIQWLEEDLGVELLRPASADSAGQREFIPCFDSKHRMWRGITRDSFEKAIYRAFEQLSIKTMERVELIDLAQTAPAADSAPAGDAADEPWGRICGAILYSKEQQELIPVSARSVIIATGGTSGLFERRLTSGDVLGSAHGIAIEHGCRLTNIEFMQMMPGLVAPKSGLVFNEKTFRYIGEIGEAPALANLGTSELKALLEQRSGHGPFTARLDDRLIDLAIDEAGPTGLAMRYDFPPKDDRPEFVQTFANWLENEHGICVDDELRVSMYAHASNGGIGIDQTGYTGVPGLYACGEATGGMHGADRIGGLSSANGLVFGRRAGAAAAGTTACDAPSYQRVQKALDHALAALETGIDGDHARKALKAIRKTMTAHCMIHRTETGLAAAKDELQRIEDDVLAAAQCDAGANDAASYARITSQLALAKAMVDAMRARRESKGAHYRAD